MYSALPHVDATNLGSCTVDGMWDRNSGLWAFFDYLHVIKKHLKKKRVKPVKTTCEHPWSLAVAPSTPQLKCGQLIGQETDRASTSPEHGDGPKGGPFWKQVLLVLFLLISSTMHFYVYIYTWFHHLFRGVSIVYIYLCLYLYPYLFLFLSLSLSLSVHLSISIYPYICAYVNIYIYIFRMGSCDGVNFLRVAIRLCGKTCCLKMSWRHGEVSDSHGGFFVGKMICKYLVIGSDW